MLMASQTLYIFLGVAVVVGALTGTSLHYISSFMISFFRLEPTSAEEAAEGRSIAEYRAEKQDHENNKDPLGKILRNNKLLRNDAAMANELKDWEWAQGERGRKGLVPNTILEEEDSSE